MVVKLQSKIIWPFVIFIVSFIIIELIFFNFFTITKQNYENIVSSDTRFNNAENILVYYDLVRESSFQNYRLSKGKEYLDRFETYVQKSNELYKQIFDETTNKVLRENYLAKYEIWEEIVKIQRGIISESVDDSVLDTEEYQLLKKDYDKKRDFPKEFYQLNVKDDMKDNIKKAKTFAIFMITAAVLTLFLLGLEMFLVKRDVIQPMNEISKGLTDIGEGKFPILNSQAYPGMKEVVKTLNKTTINLLKRSQTDISKIKGTDKLKNKILDLETEVKYLHNMLKLASVVNANQKKDLEKFTNSK